MLFVPHPPRPRDATAPFDEENDVTFVPPNEFRVCWNFIDTETLEIVTMAWNYGGIWLEVQRVAAPVEVHDALVEALS